jgi:hypothetical protein
MAALSSALIVEIARNRSRCTAFKAGSAFKGSGMSLSPALAPVLAEDFSPRQQTIIRRAFREASGMLGIGERDGLGKLVADSIVGAVRCGCLKHGELVAVALATARGAATRLEALDLPRRVLPSAA